MSTATATATKPATTKPNTKLDSVVEALRDVHDEATLWHLSDELAKIAPSGVAAVQSVYDEAQRRGIPSKSVNTLRLYRDVAIRFPASERVPLVSFSAHREAIAIGDVTQAKKVLTELAAKHGPGGVTVTTVKRAIGAQTGKVSASSNGAPKAAKATYEDVAVDLSKGGSKFIGQLDAMVAVHGVTLDNLHAGLSKVLAEVENRRAKAARKAARAKRPTPAAKAKAAPKPSSSGKAASNGKTPSKPSANGKAGDLRGL